jgi:hypothetical protein
MGLGMGMGMGMGVGMGGGMCQPWWGGGWMPNIGYGPSGYRYPVRPTRPGQPRRLASSSLGSGAKLAPYPLIAVNRRPAGGTPGLPVRDKNAQVTIAGHLVEPLRPLSPRPQYDRPTSGYVNRAAPVYPGASIGARTANGPGRVAGPVNGGGSRSYSAPAARSSSSGSASAGHASAPSYSSGGGGGGGGGASHGGGGGGGGGGGHH